MLFDQIVSKIQALHKRDEHVIVAISGFPGSGKSTLAEKLHKNFDSVIISIDHLYNKLPRGSGIFDDYNWKQLASIIKDIKVGLPLTYTGTSFEGELIAVNQPNPGITIIEGVYLFKPDFMENFDYSIWIDAPIDLAIGRAKKRDLKQGHDFEYMKRWDAEWTPRNQKYFDIFKPDKLANILYTEYK